MRNLSLPDTDNRLQQKCNLLSTGCWLSVCILVLVFGWIFATPGIAILSVAVLLCSAWLLSFSTETFNPQRITILNFWYVTYLAMIFIPAFAVFAEHEGPFRERFLFAVESTLITVPLGALLASAAAGFQKQETEKFFIQPIQFKAGQPAMFRYLAGLLALCLFATWLYFREVGTVPLFYMISNPGEHLAVALLREDSFKLLNSRFIYLYAMVRAAIFPFVIASSLGYWLKTREKRWLWMTVLSGAGGLLMASASVAKKPVAAIFLVLALFVYLFRGGRLSRKIVATCLLLIFLFPIGVVYIAYESPDVSMGDVVEALGKRMLYLPSEVVYYYYEVFPADTGFLHGRSIDKFAFMTGREYFDTPNYVGRYGFPKDLGTVSANGAFISDLNADFGMVGVLLGGILAGCIVQAIHILLIRQRKTIANLACYAFLIYGFWDLNSTSLPIVLASNGTLFLVFLVILLDRRGSGWRPRMVLARGDIAIKAPDII